MSTFSVSGTPNPNSVKLTTDEGPFLGSGLLAFNSREEASGNQLGETLFSIEGLENVLVTPDFVTVTKSAGTQWDNILPAVKSALRDHLAEVND